MRPLLGELLVQAKVVTPEQLAEALAEQTGPISDKKIGQMLIARGWMTEAQLTQTLSLQLSVPWVSLSHIDFSRQLLSRVPRELAETHCLIPIFVRHVKGQGETLYVAMDDPTNEAALVEVSRHARLPARPMIASASDIRSALRVYYGEPDDAISVDVSIPPPPPPVPSASPGAPAAPDTPRSLPASQPRVPTQKPQGPPARPSPPGAAAAAPLPAAAAAQGSTTSRAAAQGAAGSTGKAGASGASRKAAPSDPALDEELAPPTTRSSPPSAARPAVGESAAAESVPTSRPSEPRAIPKAEGSEPRRARMNKMLSLTLLDGTTLQLPTAKKNAAASDGLTARDFVSALRASAHGADASEILGEAPQWEPVVAALLSILLRKGLIADWEFVEELRKI